MRISDWSSDVCSSDLGEDSRARKALDAALKAARVLTGEGWRQRVEEGRPDGAAEGFLALARRQVYARAGGPEHGYSLDAPPPPPVAGLIAAAPLLPEPLPALCAPLNQLPPLLQPRLAPQTNQPPQQN